MQTLCSRAAVPNLSGTRDRFRGRLFFHRWGWEDGDGSGAHAGDGERWGAPDEASLSPPQLTSCCAARFLTGQGPVAVCGSWVGDPCSRVPPLPDRPVAGLLSRDLISGEGVEFSGIWHAAVLLKPQISQCQAQCLCAQPTILNCRVARSSSANSPRS